MSFLEENRKYAAVWYRNICVMFGAIFSLGMGPGMGMKIFKLGSPTDGTYICCVQCFERRLWINVPSNWVQVPATINHFIILPNCWLARSCRQQNTIMLDHEVDNLVLKPGIKVVFSSLTEWAWYSIWYRICWQNGIEQPSCMYRYIAVEGGGVPVSVDCEFISRRIWIGRWRCWRVTTQYQLEVSAYPSRVVSLYLPDHAIQPLAAASNYQLYSFSPCPAGHLYGKLQR